MGNLEPPTALKPTLRTVPLLPLFGTMFTVLPRSPLKTEIETFEEALAAKIYLESRGLLCLTCSRYPVRYPGWDYYCVHCSSVKEPEHKISNEFDRLLMFHFLRWLNVISDKAFKDSTRATDYSGLGGTQKLDSIHVDSKLPANSSSTHAPGDLPSGGTEGSGESLAPEPGSKLVR